MSDSSTDTAGLIAVAWQNQFSNYAVISGIALVSYEYALTFSTEISEIWHSKFSGAQALFFLTRYSYLVSSVLICAITFIRNSSETLCQVLFFTSNPLEIMSQIGIYGILGLRTYAIYEKNMFILAILALPGVAHVTVAVYSVVLAKPVVLSYGFGVACGLELQSLNSQFQLAGVVLALIIDVLVFALTFKKTIHHAMEMRKVGLGNGLGYFILRDGAMYFLAKLLIGVVGTTLFFIPASHAIGNWIGVFATISNPLTIVIINRLVLNLRQVSHVQQGKTSTIGEIGTIQEPVVATNSLLGNLGALLRVGPEDDEEIGEIDVDDESEIVEERGIVDHSDIIEVPRDPSDV